MKNSSIKTLLKFAVVAMSVAAMSSFAVADDKDKESTRERLVKERRLSTIAKTQTPVEGFDSVELFEAMSAGEIEVVIRTKDEANANLIVKNTTERPLAIEMPKAFSAVPVLRQLGGGGLGGGGNQGGGGQGGGGQGGGNQGVGGGAGGGGQGGGFGGGGGNQGGGGGVFNIPAGKTGRVSFKTVCLEEGKPNPKSRIQYKIQPLDQLTTDPQVFEMIRMMANDEIAQPAVQAAAWAVTDGLSWDELLTKNRIERMDGYYERFFHPNHVRLAQQVVTVAAERAEIRAKAAAEATKEAAGEHSDGEYSKGN